MRDFLTIVCAWLIGISVGALIILTFSVYVYVILRILFWIGGY